MLDRLFALMHDEMITKRRTQSPAEDQAATDAYLFQ
jgi:hypothetical protein